MTTPWRLLILADQADDDARLIAAVRALGVALETKSVRDPAALPAALAAQPVAAVLAVHHPPALDALAALPAVSAHDPDLPCIVITAEPAAVTAVMQAGAPDAVSADDLARLAPALAREIAAAEQRRARRAAEAEQARLAEALRRELAHSELLDVIVSTAAGEGDLGQLLTTALQHLSRAIGFTGGSIALLERDTLTIHAAYGPFAAQALGQRLPRRPNSRSWSVIDTGQPFSSPDVIAQGFQPTTPIRSYLAVPLVWRGQIFGLLEVDSTEANAFTPDDQALAQKVAARLSGPVDLARRVTAERAAREAEQLAGNRVRRLHRLGAALTAALLPEQVAAVAVAHGVEALGAAAGLLWRVAADPPRLEVVHAVHFPPEIWRAGDELALTADAPAAEAARTREAIWLESAAAQGTRYPARAELMRRTGFEALAFLPLTVDERVLGVLVFCLAGAHAFTPDEQAFLLTLARQCAQALERARLYAAELAARQAAELAADRISRLQTLTAALSQAVTPEAVMDTTLREGAAALDTAAAAFNLITPDGQWLEVARHLGYADEVVARYRRAPLTARLPGAEVARSGEALWLGTAEDWQPRFAEFLAQPDQQQRQFPAAAVVPLRLGGQPAGNVTFGFAAPRHFEADDRAFISAIVALSSQALERAQLYGELEARVVERTAALQREIAERRAAEQALEVSRDQLRDLSSRLQAVREEERARIAYRLHDELGQQLAGLKMDLAWLMRPSRAAVLSTASMTKLTSMAAQIDSMVMLVRSLTTELRPGLLDDFGLPAALEWQAQEFEERTGIHTEYHGASELALERDRATALFRIVQEALENVAWHAQASQVTITLEVFDDHLRLEVHDNGRGITTAMLSSPKSLGLLGMAERARQLGGSLEIKQRAGGGTQVIIRAPRPTP